MGWGQGGFGAYTAADCAKSNCVELSVSETALFLGFLLVYAVVVLGSLAFYYRFRDRRESKSSKESCDES